MASEIIFVFGKICSGKNTFCEQLALYEHIVVSDIVKKLIQSTDRNKLSDTKHLDNQIALELISMIKNKSVVIDGIRQMSVLFKIFARIHQPYDLIWLEVPTEELKRRFILRGDEKDKNVNFEEALKKDHKLGLGELEVWLKANPLTQIINNY